jgi:hypothetical protein
VGFYVQRPEFDSVVSALFWKKPFQLSQLPNEGVRRDDKLISEKNGGGGQHKEP